jgi:hypothetical protein
MGTRLSKDILVLRETVTQEGVGPITISAWITRLTDMNDDYTEIESLKISPTGKLQIGSGWHHFQVERLDSLIKIATALRAALTEEPEEPEYVPETARDRIQQEIDKIKKIQEETTEVGIRSYLDGQLSGYQTSLMLLDQEDEE